MSKPHDFDLHIAAVVKEFFPLRNAKSRTIRDHARAILKNYFFYRKLRKSLEAGTFVGKEY